MDLAGMFNQLSVNTSSGLLAGSSYIDLPVELKSPRKGPINIKNKDQKYFYFVMLDIIVLQRNIQKKVLKLAKRIP